MYVFHMILFSHQKPLLHLVRRFKTNSNRNIFTRDQGTSAREIWNRGLGFYSIIVQKLTCLRISK